MEKEYFNENYTKKQLYNLYTEAMCDEISDSRFVRIKDALHETVHLGQFSSDTFIDLLDTLFILQDSALRDIESGNFAIFYKAYESHFNGIPEDFYYVSIFLRTIYTDYKNISNIDEYKWLCDNSMLYIRDVTFLKDKKINESIMKANKSLGKLLLSHANIVDYNAVKEKQYNIEQIKAYTTIECNLLVSFLTGPEDYSSDYSLPTKLLNKIVKKFNPDVIKRIGDYMRFDDNGPMLAKQLLDRQCLEDNDVYEINELNEDKKLGEYIKKLLKSTL